MRNKLGHSDDLYDSLKLNTLTYPPVAYREPSYTRTIIVDEIGNGDYTTLTAAVAAAAALSPTGTTRVLIEVYGNTTEPAGVITIPQFVSVIGSRKDTIIECDGLKIGDGGTVQHRCELINLYIKHLSAGTIGVEVDNADEITMRGCSITNFTTGLSIGGTYSGLTTLDDCAISNSTTAVYLESCSFINFDHCNMYNNTTIFQVSVAYQVNITNSAFETFTTGFLLDETSVGVALYSLVVDNCRFLSASGGGSYTCRLVKSLAVNDTYQNMVRGLEIRGCSLWLTNAKYVIEVVWNPYLGGGADRFIASLHDNYLQNGDHTTAWFKSDNTNGGYVHLVFGNNLAPDAVAIQDGTEPIVTGFAHTALDGGTSAILLNPKVGTAGTTFTRLKHGTVQLVAGVATVSDSTVTYNSRIFVTTIGPSNQGWLVVAGVTPSTSFGIYSSNALDTSVVAWMMIEP
jgi:hypothetical protein